MIMLSSWLFFRDRKHVFAGTFVHQEWSASWVAGCLLFGGCLLQRRLMHGVVRLEQLHVTVTMVLWLIIGVKVIVLVSAAVGTSVQIGRSRSYHSPVAARAVLACHSIDVASLVLHCQMMLDVALSCNNVLAFVLLKVLISVVFFLFFMYD